ncbi:MAG: hypothetical protein MK101_05410 [Phycisphaerales bacterium]|nr:hypothetical protein [Phycisphaerales bacterium]
MADAPTMEDVMAAAPAARPALIEARLAADRAALDAAESERDRAAAALELSRSLLTLAWSQSLAPERVLLDISTPAEREETAQLAGAMFGALEGVLEPGSRHHQLLPFRAGAITLLAALGEVAPADAHNAWQGLSLRRAHPRLLRLAAWAADAAGDLGAGSDRHSMLVQQGEVTERWLAQLAKRRMLGAGQWPQPEAPWQVLLFAESRARDVSDVSASEALLADALPMLVAGGWSEDESAALLADRMAALPEADGLPFARTALGRATHAAAMVTRGDLAAWASAPVESAAAPWARVASRRAARALESRGEMTRAMAAWAHAGAAGDSTAARRAAAWALGLAADADDGGVIDRLIELPQREVSSVAAGVQARRAGDIKGAVTAWVKVPPGSSLQTAALAAAAAQLGRLDLDAMAPQVQRLRAAAAAAMTDRQDASRVELAQLAAGWTLAALIDHAIERDRLDEAGELLDADEAAVHLDTGDALWLRARLALRLGEGAQPVAALHAHAPSEVRRLLLERAMAVMGDGADRSPTPAPADARGLRELTPLLLKYLDDGDLADRLLIADALRLDGRGEPDRYRAILQSHPTAANAMFGLAELLSDAPEPEQREEAMVLYRTLAAAPVDAGPDRWWLAQLRMLQLARWAGRPDAELRARVERLRHAAPDLGGTVWAGPIQAAIQSSN